MRRDRVATNFGGGARLHVFCRLFKRQSLREERDRDSDGYGGRELSVKTDTHDAVVKVELWTDQGHPRDTFLAQCRPSPLVDKAPFTVPGQSLGSNVPPLRGRYLPSTAALNRIYRKGYDVKAGIHAHRTDLKPRTASLVHEEFLDEVDKSPDILHVAHRA